ncbi:MAG: CRISPR-associated endonuclease Cas2 [Ignavibacteriae bacterium]|nr:CRISPR-associated endonuclease Cas2 [Ignavibacteriota bacterium]
MRLNEYRIMWVLVFFDLPVVSETDRKVYTQFRKKLMKDGFDMFQFSIYVRHCMSHDQADLHIKRVKSFLPSKGKIGILRITDKQFGMMEIFEGKDPVDAKPPPQQLEMF